MLIRFNQSFYSPNNSQHGPQTWEWWRLIWLGFPSMADSYHKPTTGWRILVYSRWWVFYQDIIFDRRNYYTRMQTISQWTKQVLSIFAVALILYFVYWCIAAMFA